MTHFRQIALPMVTILLIICFGSRTSSADPISPTDVPGLANCATTQNQYVDGQYVCLNFSQDFQNELTERNINVWQYSFGSNAPVGNGNNCANHAMNIVQVDYTNVSTTAYKFCMVEPQTGATEGCWVQTTSQQPFPPTWITNQLVANIPSIAACVAQYGFRGTVGGGNTGVTFVQGATIISGDNAGSNGGGTYGGSLVGATIVGATYLGQLILR